MEIYLSLYSKPSVLETPQISEFLKYHIDQENFAVINFFCKQGFLKKNPYPTYKAAKSENIKFLKYFFKKKYHFGKDFWFEVIEKHRIKVFKWIEQNKENLLKYEVRQAEYCIILYNLILLKEFIRIKPSLLQKKLITTCIIYYNTKAREFLIQNYPEVFNE